VLLGGAWDFLFLGERDKDNAEGAECAEDAEKRKTGMGERDLVALERKSHQSSAAAGDWWGTLKHIWDLAFDRKPKRAGPFGRTQGRQAPPLQ